MRCQGAAPLPLRQAKPERARPQDGQTLRPFDEQRSVRASLVEAELVELARLLDPVEIDVPHGDPRVGRVVGLDDRKGRAGDIAGEAQAAQDAAGERGLADAQGSEQSEAVSGPELPGDGAPEGFRRRGVRKRDHSATRWAR